MTPHRLAAGFGFLVRQGAGMAPPDPGASVLVGLGALLLAHWNLHVAFLLLAAIGGGMMDLWTGARRARIRDRLGEGEAFDRRILDEGISGKVTYLVAILFLGVVLDGMIALVSSHVSLGVADLFRTYTPVMAAMLGWRTLRESSSIIQNIEATPGGKDAILPSVSKWIDALRYRLLNPGEGPVPQDRWSDRLTAEERAWVEQQLRLRRERPEGDDA